MSPVWRRKFSKYKNNPLLDLCRRPKIEERIAGFVVDFSDELILLHRLDWNTFTLDGYTLLRRKDVKHQRVFTQTSWPNRAIKSLKLRPKILPHIPLGSWSEAIIEVSLRFPLIHVERELVYPDECHLGVALKLSDKLLTLDCLNFDSEWAGPYSIKLNQITRIDFGGGYERALALTAPKRREKKQRH
jgi:hypothetical protein